MNLEQQTLLLYKTLPKQQEYFWAYRKQQQDRKLEKNRAEKLRAKLLKDKKDI